MSLPPGLSLPVRAEEASIGVNVCAQGQNVCFLKDLGDVTYGARGARMTAELHWEGPPAGLGCS